MRDFLTRLGEKRPLVVLIDDLQWADADSLALLADVLRPPDPPAMLLLATVRGSALGGEGTLHKKGAAILRDVGRLPGDVRWISLSSLTEREAYELAADLLRRAGATSPTAGRAGEDPAETIAREARGHPFFIDALVRHAALAGGPVGAGRLQEALRSSIASLDPPARRSSSSWPSRRRRSRRKRSARRWKWRPRPSVGTWRACASRTWSR